MGTKPNDDTPGSAMSYREVCNRLDDIRDDLERLNAREDKDGGLSGEDTVRFAELTTEFDELYGRKGRLEREAALAKVQKANISRHVGDMRNPGVGTGGISRGSDDYDSDPLGDPDSISENRFKDPWDVGAIRMGLSGVERGTELRSRALSAIEKMQGTTDNRREVATRMVEEYDPTNGRLSEQILATSSPQYLRAFAKLAASQGRAVLSVEEQRAVERAMSLSDANGGYLVPFQIDPTIILTSDGSQNDIRQAARQVIATGDVWNGVSAGAVQWSFDPEAEEVSDDSPTFGAPSIPIRTARGFVPISLEASMDANNVAAEVGRLLAQGKDDLESVVFVNGTAAANQPVGIISALTAYETANAGSVVVPSTGSDTLAIGDVYKLQNSLPGRYRSRASWLATNAFYNLVRQFDTTGGSALWERLGNGRPAQLLGRPVFEAEAMDGTITATQDNYLAVFGDFQNYVIADRIGMTVEFIPHLVGANRRPTGQRGWFAYYRVGAGLTNAKGLRLLNVT
jgi:HK97 family phage major capsid protein